ncbi:MAG: hypothetical protein ACRDP3_09945 [Streptomyces sp.]|uniref:hypothetical protein n=1 Tax=Streptomyces sp. TaxID=1931 RepID=UPI003D6AB584
MDTEAAVELAAKRYREAVAALDAARKDLETEAAEALREGGPEEEAAIADLTGWSPRQLRALVARVEQGDGAA